TKSTAATKATAATGATAPAEASAAAKATKPTTSARRAAPAAAGPDVVAGVALSNPDKVLYREDGITKRELAEYYDAIGELMVPHVENRPLKLVRCPTGYHARPLH